VHESYFENNWCILTKCPMWRQRRAFQTNRLIRWGTDLASQMARVTEFCTVAPNICGFSVLNLHHATLLAPRILKLLSHYFGNLCNTELFPIIKKSSVESGSEECQINTAVVTNEITKEKWNAVKNCYTHCPLQFPCFIDEYTLSTLCVNSGKFADFWVFPVISMHAQNLCSSRVCVCVCMYMCIYIYIYIYACICSIHTYVCGREMFVFHSNRGSQTLLRAVLRITFECKRKNFNRNVGNYTSDSTDCTVHDILLHCSGGGRSGVVSDIAYVVDESRIQTSVETDSKIKLGCQVVNGRGIYFCSKTD